ncbi:MAG: M24 family metallopeptidase [Treponema sp.]|jgi:Xaa-Pro aminopeptidase|nr:M24 family metallopeptidase [Treponema sp.]
MPGSPEDRFYSGELEALQKAIQKEGLDGWFFCNFRHRDKISDEILRISPESSNSRYWFYAVPVNGEPLKIIHSVEPNALDLLPGTKTYYVSREDLLASLKPLTGKAWGVHYSEELAAISYLDAGIAAVLKGAGLKLVSAAALIQRFCGLLDKNGMALHEKAAIHLYEIVKITWDVIQKAYKDQKPIFEADVRNLMIQEMEKRQLVSDSNLIAAAGKNTGNPHFNFTDSGAQIMKGDVIQLDLWTKEKCKEAIFADISWVGVFDEKVPEEAEKLFAALVSAREGAVSYIESERSAGRGLTGASVDRKAREIISSLGYKDGLKHRTGHGIDREIHGSGVNIDSIEFPDSRLLLEGSCFSLEPGLYFPDYGMRTEIDVYIRDGKPVISGHPFERQFRLLSC